MERFVIGTAGHVDHGKTTLVHALTGVVTDRLPEERRRGISIELGFAPWRLADGMEVSIVDVPGHRRLVQTMIAGASGIELVLLVVAADEGVMPQTREHLAACALLDVRDVVVALTKSDRVDAETVALAHAEVRAALEGFTVHAVVPCSARARRGLEAVGAAVAVALRSTRAGHAPREEVARLWIDRVFQVRGAGTVVTGTLIAGVIARGDTLVVAGAHGPRPVRARELHVHGAAVERADAPTRLALNIGIDAGDVTRGDLVTAGLAPDLTDRVDVDFQGGPPPRRGATLTLHVGTTHVPVDVVRVEAGGEGTHLLRLRLSSPRPLAGGDRYLLRGSNIDARNGALAGGGIVLDARPARPRLTRVLQRGDLAEILDALLDASAPRPLALSPALDRRLAVGIASLARQASARAGRGELLETAAGFVRRAVVTELASAARAMVAAHAQDAPLDRGLPLATLRQRLGADAGPEVAELAIRAARAPRGPDDVDAIALEGDSVVLAVRAPGSELAKRMAVARGELERAGLHGLSHGRLIEVTVWPAAPARAVLAALERSGDATRAGDLWFTSAFVETMRARVREHLVAGGGSLTVAAMKSLCGLPRRQAILLLEHLDATGETRRVGDARVAGASR